MTTLKQVSPNDVIILPNGTEYYYRPCFGYCPIGYPRWLSLILHKCGSYLARHVEVNDVIVVNTPSGERLYYVGCDCRLHMMEPEELSCG